MRKLLLFLLFGMSLPVLRAQSYDQKIPDYGKVSKEELQVKECSFDKAAEAYVIFDVAEVYCSFYPTMSFPVQTEIDRHVRIKIINTKGQRHADIRIPYYAYLSGEEIKNLTAHTYNIDASGNIVTKKIEKDLFYDKKLDARFSQKIFTFPDVKPGSVIEYKYKVRANWFGGLKNWYFQRSIPVQYSRYSLDFPQEFDVRAIPYCGIPYDFKSNEKNNRFIQSYTMVNLPALRDEPYISCDRDYLQRVEPQLIALNFPGQPRVPLLRTWPQVVKVLMEDEDFGIQLKREIPRTADLDAQLLSKKTQRDKLATIFYYVRKNMEWNGYDNIWALDGVRSAWKDKKGTSGEINLILVNLLKDAGIDAHAVLVSTLENGRVNTSLANTAQFDKVMAYAELDGNTYVLDATDKYTPYNLIPRSVAFTEGMVIEKPLTFQWGWKVLWDEKQMYRNRTYVLARLKDDVLTGTANISSSGYSRTLRIADLKSGKSKYIEKYFTGPNPGVKIDSVTIENEDTDSLDLTHKFDFTMPVSVSGEYKNFKLSLFSGFEQNIFSADTRFSDVFFGANQYHTVVGSFTIPDDYEFDELPRNIKMIMPDTSITVSRILQASGNELASRIVIEFNKPFYGVSDYPAFQEFYKQLFDLLDEQIIIKKKSKP